MTIGLGLGLFLGRRSNGGTLDAAITAPTIALAVGQTTYPPQFDITLDDTAAVGDRVVMQRLDLDTTLLETYSHVITAGEALANAIALGLSGVLSGTYDYRARIVQAGTNNYSNWSNTVEHGPDITAPVLTSPIASSTGTTTASIGVTTDTAEGTLYAVLTTSATPPSKAQVKAGQNNTGAAAAWTGNQAVTATGAKTFSPTGLTAATTYYAYFMHEDASTNQSTVATASSFATDASSPVSLHATHNFNTQNIGYASTAATFTAGSIGTVASNRVCIACIVTYDGATNQPTGVTIGGVTATQVKGTSGSHISMWQASVPTGTTADVVVTNGANIGWAGCILESILTGSPTATATYEDTWAADGTNPTVTPTTPTDGLTLAFAAKDATGVTASWTGATADAFKDNLVWSIGTASRTGASTSAVTAGGFSGSNNGMLAASWGP